MKLFATLGGSVNDPLASLRKVDVPKIVKRPPPSEWAWRPWRVHGLLQNFSQQQGSTFGSRATRKMHTGLITLQHMTVLW